MTWQGVILIDLIALGLLIWVLNLVRRGKLYVGYGVIFIVSFVAIIITVSTPQLLYGLTALVGAAFPASALTLLALAFVAFMFIYVLSQLTIISNRIAHLTQELAIRRTTEEATPGEGQVLEDVSPTLGEYP
jgi:hypothetical protein